MHGEEPITQTPDKMASAVGEFGASSGPDRSEDSRLTADLYPAIGSEAEFELWLLTTLERERARIMCARNG
ncbi:MAG TPA: hypothetical protein VEJ67_08745 [Candidatus Cybelea sp.]|nr:hypothetical protein [Candidatus Cybelea sp.]